MAYSLTLFGHIRSFRGGWNAALEGRRFLAQIVKLQPAERAPVQARAEKLLQIAKWILVDRVDVIDSAELFHAKTSTTGAAALSAEQEQIPLVPHFAAAAFLAPQNSVIDELLAQRSANAYQYTSATHAILHVCSFIPNIANPRQVA